MSISNRLVQHDFSHTRSDIESSNFAATAGTIYIANDVKRGGVYVADVVGNETKIKKVADNSVMFFNAIVHEIISGKLKYTYTVGQTNYDCYLNELTSCDLDVEYYHDGQGQGHSLTKHISYLALRSDGTGIYYLAGLSRFKATVAYLRDLNDAPNWTLDEGQKKIDIVPTPETSTIPEGTTYFLDTAQSDFTANRFYRRNSNQSGSLRSLYDEINGDDEKLYILMSENKIYRWVWLGLYELGGGSGSVNLIDDLEPHNPGVGALDAHQGSQIIQYVDDAIEGVSGGMVFKGSLGTGGTIQTLPAASSSNKGWMYKVITPGTYAGQQANIGDMFISDGSSWVYIPSGEGSSGTVTSVKINATTPIVVDNSSAITVSGERTLSHANSGVTAGTYTKVTVNETGHVTNAGSLVASDLPVASAGVDVGHSVGGAISADDIFALSLVYNALLWK